MTKTSYEEKKEFLLKKLRELKLTKENKKEIHSLTEKYISLTSAHAIEVNDGSPSSYVNNQ